MSLRAAFAVVALGFGCSDSGRHSQSADARRYAELVADPAPDPAVAMPACLALSEPTVQGECALAIALAARNQGAHSLDALCPTVPEGVWRDECWFMDAEYLHAADRDGAAAAACLRAGLFSHECGQHLWEPDLRRLVRSPKRQDMAARLRRADRLYAVWAPRLAGTDMDWRFWQYFFEAVHELTPGVNLEECAVIADAALAMRCRYSGGHLYLRRSWDHLRRPYDLARMCALDPRTVDHAGQMMPHLAARPDPLLQAVLDEALAAGCAPAQFRPVREGAVSRAALDAALDAIPASDEAEPTPD
jgi:hypothetical protein